jgi:hypothetical protein
MAVEVVVGVLGIAVSGMAEGRRDLGEGLKYPQRGQIHSASMERKCTMPMSVCL